MEDMLFPFGEKERRILKEQMLEICRQIQNTDNLDAGLLRYAEKNGCTRDMFQEVVETVERYNELCLKTYREGVAQSIQEEIDGQVQDKDMNQSEEIVYKLSFLQAIFELREELLKQMGVDFPTEWVETKENYCLLLNQLSEQPPKEELLEGINEALADGLTELPLPLYYADTFAKHLEGMETEYSGNHSSANVWEDDKTLKCCAATATCVSVWKGILDKGSMPLRSIVLGVCQGIDLQNMERKYARGDITRETFLNMLQAAGVSATMLLCRGSALALGSVQGLAELLRHALSVSVGIASVTAEKLVPVIDRTVEWYSKIFSMDTENVKLTFEMFRSGASQLQQYVREQTLPHAKDNMLRAVDSVRNLFDLIRLKIAVIVQKIY